MKVYKIRDKRTGLFSTGGTSPRWTTVGKSWSCIGHVKCHLTLLQDLGRSKKFQVPEEWDVVEYVYLETSTSLSSARELALRAAKK